MQEETQEKNKKAKAEKKKQTEKSLKIPEEFLSPMWLRPPKIMPDEAG
jgi:F0F1-type ATP synthase assembly protein I